MRGKCKGGSFFSLLEIGYEEDAAYVLQLAVIFHNTTLFR